MLIVESNGDGSYTLSEVEGNYPADYPAIQSKQFANRDAAERAAQWIHGGGDWDEIDDQDFNKNKNAKIRLGAGDRRTRQAAER